MIQTLQELKDFILWAREAKIKALNVAGIQVEFSDLAFIDDIAGLSDTESIQGNEHKDTSKTLVDSVDPSQLPESEDDLLFWSSKA